MGTLSRMRSKLTFSNVVAGGAIAIVMTAGTAYAANEWTGANIVDGSLSGQDLAANSVPGGKITNGTVGGKDIKNDSLESIDYGDGSIAGVDVLDGSLSGSDVASSSLFGSDVADGSLTNQDISVYYANVTQTGVVNESSGGISVVDLAASRYEVDFGRDVSQCGVTANPGGPDTQAFQGTVAIWDSGTDNQDLIVDTEDQAGSDLDLPFHIIVVC